MSKLSFSVISDVHITHFGFGEREFENALKFNSERFEDDAVIFCGDIIYQLDNCEDVVCRNIYSTQYDFVNQAVKKYIPEDTEKIFILGNHEFAQNNDDGELTQKALKIWKDKFGQPVREHRVVSGYHFIKLPVRNWGMSKNRDDERWLEQEIEKAAADGDNKPIFVLSHDCMPNTVAFSYNGTSFSDEISEYLKKQSRVIHITGHYHFHISDEKAIFQDGFTTVSSPLCSVGAMCVDGCEKLNPPVFGISQGLHFDVSDTKVTISKIDYNTGQITKNPWLIDTNETKQGIFRYGKHREDKFICNMFAEDAKAEASDAGESIEICIKQSFENDCVVQYYHIEVLDDKGDLLYETNVCTDFYNPARGIPVSDEYKICIKKPAKKAHTVFVSPLNCFFKTKGRKLKADIK